MTDRIESRVRMRGADLPRTECASCGIEWSETALRVQVSGSLSSSALLQAARTLTSDLRYAQLKYFVVDFLDVQWRDADFLDLLENLLSVLGAAPKTRIAVVARDRYIVEFADAIVRLGPVDFPPVFTFTDRDSVERWVAQHSPEVAMIQGRVSLIVDAGRSDAGETTRRYVRSTDVALVSC